MRVLITGASGFFGKEIEKAFRTKDYYDIDTLGRAYSNKFKYDLQTDEIDFGTCKHDLVIHVAGKAHIVPKTKDESDSFFNVNYVGTKNLCKAFDRSKFYPKFFVFISTVSVYGLIEGNNISEDNPLAAEDPYGKSKALSEIYLNDWCSRHQISLLILRLPLIVGSKPPGNLKRMINGIKYGYYFSVDNGKARRSMVLAKDVAELIEKVYMCSGTYNLCDGYHPSYREIEDQIRFYYCIKRIRISFPLWFVKKMAFFGDVFTFIPFNTTFLKKISSDFLINDQLARVNLKWHPRKVLDAFGSIITHDNE